MLAIKPSDFSEPTTSRSDLHQHRVLETWKALTNATGADCAYHLSNAGYFLSIGVNGGVRLTREERHRLLAAVDDAEPRVARDVPPGLTVQEIRRGFSAYRSLVKRWGRTHPNEKVCDAGASDVAAEARIFRNSCHNIDLRLQIQQRSDQRRAAVVASLAAIGQSFLPKTAREVR